MMLDWQGKNCIGLVEAIEAAGIVLYDSPEGEFCSDPFLAQEIIDGFDCAAWMLSVKLPEVKQLAQDRILARMPAWKQSNMTARAVELISLGEVGSEEWNALQAEWAWARSVREFSNQLEKNLAQDPTIDITAGWPE